MVLKITLLISANMAKKCNTVLTNLREKIMKNLTFKNPRYAVTNIELHDHLSDDVDPHFSASITINDEFLTQYHFNVSDNFGTLSIPHSSDAFWCSPEKQNVLHNLNIEFENDVLAKIVKQIEKQGFSFSIEYLRENSN